MDGIISGLNAAQRSAVTSPSPVLQVLAPPGSGKTKTLTARVAYLLTHNGYAPWNIICCTFTIKASREMRERLKGLIGEELESKLILGTFHSICRRYLVRYGNRIGLQSGFGIADSADSLAIIKRIVKRQKLNIEPSTARSRISHVKAQGRLHDQAHPSKKKNVEQQEFEIVLREYEEELARSNLLDYDDLLLRCLELLERSPECVSNVEAVLIDEFQDTNTVQFELMKLFASAKKRITIVGDPDQSIYGFRSAEIANLVHMQKFYPDTVVINLEENYRSCGAILASAQDVIEQDTTRPNKRLKPTHRPGTLPTFRKIPSAYAEASWLVLEIQRTVALSGKMLNYSDFAVLLRSAALSRLIESAMGKAGIPYRMVGGVRFFDRKEVRILLDYLRTVSQPQNNDALLAIINTPARGIGEETVKALVEEADTLKIPLFTFIRDIIQGNRKPKKPLRKPVESNLASFLDVILKSRDKLSGCEPCHAPKLLLNFILKKLSFKEYLEKAFPEEEENRWANVQELLAQADDVLKGPSTAESEALPEIEGIEQQTANGGAEMLAMFLANIALSSEVQSEEGDAQQQRVTISTIHAAKGLEWPVVFVPAVYQGSIPHSRAEDTDEERRLLYVAMTRAQALLYLSCPLRQSRDNEETTSSIFLTPKGLGRYFQNSGPVFDDFLLRTISHTLRRDPPSEEVIVQEMQKLRSIKDDLWPLTGEPGDEEKRRWEQNGTEGRGFPGPSDPTNRKAGFHQSFINSSTMDQAKNFSVPTTYNSSFTTASHHLQTSQLVEEQQKAQNDSKQSKQVDKATSKSQAQGSISNFFKGPPKSTPIPPSTKAAGITRPIDLPKQRQGYVPLPLPTTNSYSIRPTGISQAMSQKNSIPQVPEHLAQHRLPSGTMALKRPRPLADVDNNYRRKKHELQSSSPPPEFGKGNEGENPSKEKGLEGNKPDAPISSGFRPVTTMHTTTMMNMQNQGTGVGRKTYGIRRSMNGWADRMKRG